MGTNHDCTTGHKHWLVPILFCLVVTLSGVALPACGGASKTAPGSSASQSVRAEEVYDPTVDINAIKTGIAHDLDPLKTPTPEIVGQFLEGVDQAKIQQLQSTKGFDVREMLVHLLRGFDYEVIEVAANKDTATAKLRMTCLDGAKAIENARIQVVNDEERGLLGELYGSGEDEDWKKLIARLVEIIYDNLDSCQEMVSRELTLGLAKQNNTWSINAEDLAAILSAVTAGMS